MTNGRGKSDSVDVQTDIYFYFPEIIFPFKYFVCSWVVSESNQLQRADTWCDCYGDWDIGHIMSLTDSFSKKQGIEDPSTTRKMREIA